MRKNWPCLLLLCLTGLVACSGEEKLIVDAPPVGGEQPEPPAPPAPPEPPDVDPDPLPSIDPGPRVLNPARGQTLFAEKCQHCHGPGGVGGYGPALTNTVTCPPCRDFTELWLRIDEYMPFRNPEACVADCARDIAAWISNDFSVIPSCSVEFHYETVTARQFNARVRIVNFRGRDLPRWRLAFTLPPNHALVASSNATVTQSGNQVLLLPLAGTPEIANGTMLEIGLAGTHGGVAITPTDLRLEASPCFTAPPVPS